MDWRSWLKSERSLLTELALLLAVMLVVGVYFLERLETGLQADQRRHLQALAQYLAADSADYLAVDNRVSLGVIARQAARLDTVAAVEVRDTRGRALAHAGPQAAGPALIQQPITGEAGSPVGRIQLWPAEPDGVQRRVESGFVLVVMLLLALRMLGEVIRRRLWPAGQAYGAASTIPDEVHAPLPRAEAHLWVRSPDAERLRERYTPSLVNRVLDEYQGVFNKVARYHGARRIADLNGPAHLTFTAESAAEATFQALCAAELLRRCVYGLGREHGSGRPRPALQLFVSATARDDVVGVLEAAGDPDGIYVPAEELAQGGLGDRVRVDEARRVTVPLGEQSLTLQGVDRLSPRYEQLITSQAGKLVPRSGADPA